MNNRIFLRIFGAVAISILALAACRAEEQGRVNRYKPGVYLGQKDTQLTKVQEEQLRERASGQGGATLPPVGGR
jgi:Tfp pilus assembly protein PilP